jgi:hypothetical protein
MSMSYCTFSTDALNISIFWPEYYYHDHCQGLLQQMYSNSYVNPNTHIAQPLSVPIIM